VIAEQGGTCTTTPATDCGTGLICCLDFITHNGQCALSGVGCTDGSSCYSSTDCFSGHYCCGALGNRNAHACTHILLFLIAAVVIECTSSQCTAGEHCLGDDDCIRCPCLFCPSVTRKVIHDVLHDGIIDGENSGSCDTFGTQLCLPSLGPDLGDPCTASNQCNSGICCGADVSSAGIRVLALQSHIPNLTNCSFVLAFYQYSMRDNSLLCYGVL
jgi:hypothetical protein